MPETRQLVGTPHVGLRNFGKTRPLNPGRWATIAVRPGVFSQPVNCGGIEHGPRGGDELNLIENGKNDGRPLVGACLSTAACDRLSPHLLDPTSKGLRMRLKHLLVAALIAVPVVGFAQGRPRMNTSGLSIEVGFGVFPPTGGLRRTAMRGRFGRCRRTRRPVRLQGHLLNPEEVTVLKGKSPSTFMAVGTRSPSTKSARTRLAMRLASSCVRGSTLRLSPIPRTILALGNAANAGASKTILDGHNDVVIISPSGGPHPNNRVWCTPGRLMSAGGQHFLTGIPPGVPPNVVVTATTGQLVTYSFLKTGRYLVICMNRSHFQNGGCSGS